jgi:hypothetical protein
MPYALAFAGDSLVAGLADGRVFLSDNRGASWAPVALDGAALGRIAALAPLPDR